MDKMYPSNPAMEAASVNLLTKLVSPLHVPGQVVDVGGHDHLEEVRENVIEAKRLGAENYWSAHARGSGKPT